MATATKRKVTRKTQIRVEQPTIEEIETPKVIQPCFYCRESKYEPSTTGCPVSSHSRKK